MTLSLLDALLGFAFLGLAGWQAFGRPNPNREGRTQIVLAAAGLGLLMAPVLAALA